MNNKLLKVLSFTMIGALSLSLFSGCSYNTKTPEATTPAVEKTTVVEEKTTAPAEEMPDSEKIVVKVGLVLAATHPVTQAMYEEFEPIIEEKTNGKYDIQIYDSSQLGNEKQLYDYVRNGIVDVIAVGTVMWSEVPMMATPDFPFVFRDVAHARSSYLSDEVGGYIADTFEAQEPIKFLAWFPNGARVFSSSKPLEKIEDFKGLKLRMPNNPIHVQVAESLGANPAIMDFGEVFTALEQKVVDGQDNPLSTFRREGWFEVQDYVYETNHMVSSIELLAGTKFWDKLSDEDKAIFEEASLAASNKGWDLYEASIKDDKAFLETSGLTVTTPTAEEHDQLVEMMKPVYDTLYKQYDWAEDMIARIAAVK